MGDPGKPAANPVDVDAIRKRTNALDHQVFGGKLDRQTLGFGDARSSWRCIAEGDFRAWDAVTKWATEIAETLEATPVAPGR